MKTLVTHPNVIVEEHGPDLLVVRLRGEGDDTAVSEAFALSQPILEAKAPVKVIIDGRGFSGLSMSARWRLSMRIKENRALIARTFVYGLSDVMTFVARVIIRASGRDNIELVDSEADAYERAVRRGSSVRAAS